MKAAITSLLAVCLLITGNAAQDHDHTTPAGGAVPSSTSTATVDHEDTYDNGNLVDSPTSAAGCVGSGDHWHCPAPATATPASATEEKHANEGEEDHEATYDDGKLVDSPTSTAGCIGSGDHWHCPAPAAVTPAPGAEEKQANEGNEDDEATYDDGRLVDSPTSTTGCIGSGDHWHCPAPSVTPAPTAEDKHDYEGEEDHEDTYDNGRLVDSPTSTAGCIGSGDHWHCPAPVATATAPANATSDTGGAPAGNGTVEVFTGDANAMRMGLDLVVAGFMVWGMAMVL